MLRQADNKVEIEGILSEINIEEKTYVKNGENKEALSGSMKIKVLQKIGEEKKELEIPVYIFAQKYTSTGAINPSYNSIDKFRNTATSIAAAGGIEGADWIQIKSGKISENSYYRNGKLITFPRINVSFVNKIPAKNLEDSFATFSIELMVAKKEFEVDKNGR